MDTIDICVYTIVLTSVGIKPIYKAVRKECKGYDLPMYLELEGGSMPGCYYLIATPSSFTIEHMKEVLSIFVKDPEKKNVQHIIILL